MSDYAGSGDEGLTQTWYAKPNDLIGGWCIMNVDKTPANADIREREFEIASFIGEKYARRIADLHNRELADESAQSELEKRARRPLPPGPQRDRLMVDLEREKPLDCQTRVIHAVRLGDTGSALARLREDLSRMESTSQRAMDLVKVLDEFDDMRKYLNWELISAEQAAMIDDDLEDGKMVSRRKTEHATVVPSETFDELMQDAPVQPNERTRAAAAKLHQVVRTEQDIADETFGTFETLLGEWFDWWRSADEAPTKMPDALHVRTAMALIMREANKAQNPEERAEFFERMQERLLGPTIPPYVEVSNDELRFDTFRDAAPQGEPNVKVTHLPTGHTGKGATKEEAVVNMYEKWGQVDG